MGRHESITRYITREARGIEIGAWYNGMAPKRDGFNCLTLDVFDTETLRRRARESEGIDGDLIKLIEDVDLVGSSHAIADLVRVRGELGGFDYIVSSHNIEHCPDPITFFRGCEEVLKHGGYLSMIVPDRRGCFDYFRPNSTTAEMLSAFFEKRQRPTDTQIFEHCSLHARHLNGSRQEIVFPFSTDPGEIVPFEHLRIEFDLWEERVRTGDDIYRDAHCWTFTPASFELILRDLSFLGLTKFAIAEIEPSEGEFFVHLRSGGYLIEEDNEFYKRRRDLLLRMNDESSCASPRVRDVETKLISSQEKISRLESDLADAKQVTHDIETANAALKMRAEADLRAIQESTSWRLTALFRFIAGFLRKITG